MLVLSLHFSSLSSREEFRATEMGSTLTGGDKLHPWLVDHLLGGILFVQGEREYLEAAHHKLDEFENIQVIYTCSDPSFWSAGGARVSHKNCGGVTDREWTIYSEGIRLPEPEPAAVERQLKHIISSVEGKGSVKQLSSATDPFLAIVPAYLGESLV